MQFLAYKFLAYNRLSFSRLLQQSFYDSYTQCMLPSAWFERSRMTDINVVTVLIEHIEPVFMCIVFYAITNHHGSNSAVCLVIFIQREQTFKLFHPLHMFINMINGQFAFTLDNHQRTIIYHQ